MNTDSQQQIVAAVLTAQESEQYRLQLVNIGGQFGRRVVVPMSDYTDLRHKEKQQKNEATLVKPIRKYYVQAVDITQLIPTRRADGSLAIIVNGDPRLKFTLSSCPEVQKTMTEQDVHTAIIRYESTGDITFFSDVQLVTNVCNELNVTSANRLREFANDFLAQADSVEAINDLLLKSTSDYFESLSK